MAEENKKATGKIPIKKDTTKIIALRQSKSKRWYHNARYLRSLILAAAFLGVVLFFPYSTNVQNFNLPTPGSVSDETIIAPITFDILKSAETLERERDEAKKQVLLVFRKNEEGRKFVNKRLLALKNEIVELADTTVSQEKSTEIRNRLKKILSDKSIEILINNEYLIDDVIFQADKILESGLMSILLTESIEKLTLLKDKYNAKFINHLVYDKEYITLLTEEDEQTVSISDIPVKEMALENVMENLKIERAFDQDALNSVYEVLDVYLSPNITLDGEETSHRQQMAQKAVLSTKGKVIKDTEIIRKHQVVTDDILEKLISLHLAIKESDSIEERGRIWRTNAGMVALVMVLLIMTGYYTRMYHRNIYNNPKHIGALVSIVILQIIFIRVFLLILPLIFENITDISSLIPELIIPVATASILTAILFNTSLSIMITLFISLYFGSVLSFNLPLVMYSFSGGVVAAFVTSKVRYRWDFFKAIPPIVASYSVFTILWNLVNYDFSPVIMFQNIGLAVLGAIASTFLAMMTVTVYETIFDITTNMTLVELSDMNHPLLKRLSIEAAGTYNHSVLVANLAESAAERVGANPLLVRVASYYHDVGKINKPTYFSENQKFEKNKHDKLEPSMSALIIANHVKDGMEMGKKFKLPSVIMDAITQHHGDNLVSFFYHKALELDPTNSKQIKKSEFSYPGPKPQSKECAIIMLADSVEAASRSLATSSPKMLRDLVKKIIYDKFQSHQLDECDLTFKELDQIIDGFMPVLQGIFHTRVEYPNTKQEK